MASTEHTSTSTDPSQAVPEEAFPGKPQVLEGIASRLVSCSLYILLKARQLPCPLGSTVGLVEDVVNPRLQPLVTFVASRGFYVLSLVDEQLDLVGGEVERRVPGVSLLIQKADQFHVVSQKAARSLRRRGLVGVVADAWVEHEVIVKSKSEGVLNFVRKVPVVRIFVPVVQSLGVPLAQAGSNWLSRHSEVQDKHPLISEEGASVLQMDELETDFEEKGTTDVHIVNEVSPTEAQQPDEKISEEKSKEKLPQDMVSTIGTQTEGSDKTARESDVPQLSKETMEEDSFSGAPHSGDTEEEEVVDSKVQYESDEDPVENLFHQSWSLKPLGGAKK